MIEVASLSDEELAALLDEARLEYQRRQNLVAAVEAAPEFADAMQAALGRTPDTPWVQPLGAFDAYPRDWVTPHKGKTWVSLVDENVWEPGVTGWREQTNGTPPQWVQPTGAHDAYMKGDRVTDGGDTYTSDVDHNVWPPSAYGWSKD